MGTLSTRSALVLLAGLWPLAARAERPLSASLRTDVALYPSSAIAPGPSLGVQASAGVTSQLSVVLGASSSRHAIDPGRGGGHLEVSQVGCGLSFLLDDAPILPYVHAGVMAAYRDTGRARALGPWPYVGLELVLPVKAPFTVGLDARYTVQLQSGLAEFGYAQFGLSLGLLRGLRPP